MTRLVVSRTDSQIRSQWVGFEIGSPRTGKIRTFLRVTTLARIRFYTKLNPETAYRLLVQRSIKEALAELAQDTPTAYTHRNPVALAREWQGLLDNGAVPSRAGLARQLGVSRAHVTQVLSILRLPLQRQNAVLSLGDPLVGKQAGIHTLRAGQR